MDEYYKNLDDNVNYSSTYPFETLSDKFAFQPIQSFTVSIFIRKIIAMVVFLIIPIMFFLASLDFLRDLSSSGLKTYSDMFVIFLVILFLFGIAMIFVEAGKSISVNGDFITIKTWFFVSETISIRNVTKCDVITGLYVHNKYGGHFYNKAVIYYSGNKKIAFTDTTYNGWNDLVNYMRGQGKAVEIDGRNKLFKMVDDYMKK